LDLKVCKSESINKHKKYISVKLEVPVRYYDIIGKVATVLECKPDVIFQKSLNHALKTGTLGHVLESMLNEKYHDVFNSPRNEHDLTL
jgi:hypothetical protein